LLFLLAAEEEVPTVLFALVAACVLVSVLGVAALLLGRRREGAWLVLVGSAVLVPLGIIAALGARKVLDRLALEEFERRRGER
jgi:uncharacterized membrane protein YbhN (UPF0104 family)